MPDVKVSKRQETQFEVIHHLYKIRKEITNLLLYDFGFSEEKAKKQIEKKFSGHSRGELSESEQERYDRELKRMQAFYDWFIQSERDTIQNSLRNVGRCIFAANDGIPQYWEELVQRRLYQDEALGWCDNLKQELQYAIETLPVNVNKYTRFSKMIDREINLVKKWRTSDNRFKKTVIMPPDYRAMSDSATNFANCNNNGNANNNSASNSNGVRPDFDGAH